MSEETAVTTGLLSRAVIGTDDMARIEAQQENHGRYLSFSKTKKHAIIPLQVFDDSQLPQEIADLKNTSMLSYLTERIKRQALCLQLLTFGLNDTIQTYNDAEKKKAEANPEYKPFYLFGSYKFQLLWSKDDVVDYVDTDPIAWFFHNIETLREKVLFPFSQFGAVRLQNRAFMIVQDMTGAERIVEMSYNQFKDMTEVARGNLKMLNSGKGDAKKNVTDLLWEIEQVGTGKDTKYRMTPNPEFDLTTVPFDTPAGTTLDLENHPAYGVLPENIALRRQILAVMGLEDEFPATAKWNQIEEETE